MLNLEAWERASGGRGMGDRARGGRLEGWRAVRAVQTGEGQVQYVAQRGDCGSGL